MKIKSYAIIDLGFGDAGKGKCVDWLSRNVNNQWVIRFNGGSQAAHNVVLPDGFHHTFSQFGSGTLSGKYTYLSKYMSIDPLAAISEHEHLEEYLGYSVFNTLHINKECKVITPYHRALNRFKESHRKNDKHGSCGIGYGECISLDISNPELTLYYKDLINLKKIKAVFERQRSFFIKNYPSIIDYSDFKNIERHMYDIIINYEWMYSQTCMVDLFEQEYEILSTDNNIFEGAQGIMLDETFGCNPYTTWSNCTSDNIIDMYSYHNIDYDLEVIGVFRAFPTRHGKGPFPTENKNISNIIKNDHNITNEWQDELRVGELDLCLLRYAISKCKINSFIITYYDMVESTYDIIEYDNGIALPNVNNYEDSFKLTEYLENFQKSNQIHTTIMKDEVLSKFESILNIPCKMISTGSTYEDVK